VTRHSCWRLHAASQQDFRAPSILSYNKTCCSYSCTLQLVRNYFPLVAIKTFDTPALHGYFMYQIWSCRFVGISFFSH
jgi:hypothetical protein